MNIIITGSRTWTDYATIRRALLRLKARAVAIGEALRVTQGECKDGADLLAKKACASLSIPCDDFPANWTKYGNAAGMIRNRAMIDAVKPALVVGFFDSSGDKARIKRSGTLGCLRYADKKGCAIELHAV